MAEEEYGKVVVSFWRDPKLRHLDPMARYLALYYFTCPHKNMAGLFYCPIIFASKETGLPATQIQELLKGPLSPFMTYDETSEEILVHRMARRQVGATIKGGDNRLTPILKTVQGAHSQSLVTLWKQLHRDWIEGAGEAPREGGTEAPPQASSSNSSSNNSSSSSSNSNKQPAAGDQPRLSVRCSSAANAGLRANPRLAGVFTELQPSQAEQWVDDWTKDGIALETIVATIERLCQRFNPTNGRRQPTAFSYFDGAIREAHTKAQAIAELGTTAPKPKATLRDMAS